jgi:hypothetical protein
MKKYPLFSPLYVGQTLDYFFLYQIEFETVLIGVFRKLTLKPLFLEGVIFQIILLIELIRPLIS